MSPLGSIGALWEGPLGGRGVSAVDGAPIQRIMLEEHGSLEEQWANYYGTSSCLRFQKTPLCRVGIGFLQ